MLGPPVPAGRGPPTAARPLQRCCRLSPLRTHRLLRPNSLRHQGGRTNALLQHLRDPAITTTLGRGRLASLLAAPSSPPFKICFRLLCIFLLLPLLPAHPLLLPLPSPSTLPPPAQLLLFSPFFGPLLRPFSPPRVPSPSSPTVGRHRQPVSCVPAAYAPPSPPFPPTSPATPAAEFAANSLGVLSKKAFPTPFHSLPASVPAIRQQHIAHAIAPTSIQPLAIIAAPRLFFLLHPGWHLGHLASTPSARLPHGFAAVARARVARTIAVQILYLDGRSSHSLASYPKGETWTKSPHNHRDSP